MFISIPSNESMVDMTGGKIALAVTAEEEGKREQTASPSGVMNFGASFSTGGGLSPSPRGASPNKPCKATASSVALPFFIMDCLEDVDPESLELVHRLLQTPPSKKSALNLVPPPKSPKQESLKPVRKDLFTSFQQRSIAVGNGYNAKGIQKARQGHWERALRCWENALEIRLQISASSSGGEEGNHSNNSTLELDVANTRNNIGIALGKLNRLPEAVASLEEALQIRQQQYGDIHPEVAATLHNLGNVFQQAGDYAQAIHYFGACRHMQECIAGTVDHLEVARACLAMGHTYYQAGGCGEDARAAYADALQIFHRVGLPADDPEVLTTLDDVRDADRQIALQEQEEP